MKPPGRVELPGGFYSSSRNTRDFSREIRAQSEIWLHREYNLAMKSAQWKALTRRARRGKNAEAFLKSDYNYKRPVCLV